MMSVATAGQPSANSSPDGATCDCFDGAPATLCVQTPFLKALPFPQKQI